MLFELLVQNFRKCVHKMFCSEYKIKETIKSAYPELMSNAVKYILCKYAYSMVTCKMTKVSDSLVHYAVYLSPFQYVSRS